MGVALRRGRGPQGHHPLHARRGRRLSGDGAGEQAAARGTVKRFAALAFGAVLLATAILAVLGYLSLRHWETSAELLFREQARDMAVMAAEKIEMTVLKSEEECLGALQRLLVEPA